MTKTLKPKLQTPQAGSLPDLIAITQDAADATRLAADLFATTAYRAQRILAAAAGMPTPRAPKPRSKYMQHFIAGVSARLTMIAGLLDPDELGRLKKIGAAIVQRLESNDAGIIDEIVELLHMEPEASVKWIREHFGEIEARFSS